MTGPSCGGEALREAFARTLTTWVIGVAHENAWNCADRLMALPEVAALLAERDKAARQVTEARGLHTSSDGQWCDEDGFAHPCRTRRMLDGTL